MQFQVQERRDETKQRDELDLYVGLRTGLDDPFNIFVRVADLEENRSLLYFYAYSMGKKKVVVWGVFDRENNEFLIDDACQYTVNELKSIVDSFKDSKYQFFFSSVKDRISKRHEQNRLFSDRNYDLDLMNKLRTRFLQKLVKNGSLKGDVQEFYENGYRDILSKVASEAMNAIVKTRDYDAFTELLLKEIDNTEDENLVRKALDVKNVKYLNLNKYPTHLQNIIKFILVNVFILIFADMEEYRVAKYIISLKKKENVKLSAYIKGGFLYEWIYELAKTLRIENIKDFMNEYSVALVKLMENKINLTDVGVIGNRNMKSYLGIQEMTQFFEEFISKSEYTKFSYTKDLPFCPKVFSDFESKFDLT